MTAARSGELEHGHEFPAVDFAEFFAREGVEGRHRARHAALAAGLISLLAALVDGVGGFNQQIAGVDRRFLHRPQRRVFAFFRQAAAQVDDRAGLGEEFGVFCAEIFFGGAQLGDQFADLCLDVLDLCLRG